MEETAVVYELEREVGSWSFRVLQMRENSVRGFSALGCRGGSRSSGSCSTGVFNLSCSALTSQISFLHAFRSGTVVVTRFRVRKLEMAYRVRMLRGIPLHAQKLSLSLSLSLNSCPWPFLPSSFPPFFLFVTLSCSFARSLPPSPSYPPLPNPNQPWFPSLRAEGSTNRGRRESTSLVVRHPAELTGFGTFEFRPRVGR